MCIYKDNDYVWCADCEIYVDTIQYFGYIVHMFYYTEPKKLKAKKIFP